MNFTRTRIILLGATVALSSALSSSMLFAQMDPMSPPASATQANPSQPPASTTSMRDSVGNAGDIGQIMKDKMFLRRAAESNIAQVKFGQLVAEKATSDDVKAFGQTMIDDHTQLNHQLAPVADAMGIRLPQEMNKDDQAEYEKLKALSGSDFETAYLILMLKEHHQAIRNFRVEANSVSDEQLKDVVTKGERVIHEHLVMLNKLAREKGIPMPTHGGKPAPPPAS